MNNELNLNIDAQTLGQCLKSINDFGGTTLLNICTGSEQYVPWGSADWLGFSMLFALGMVFLLFFLLWLLNYLLIDNP